MEIDIQNLRCFSVIESCVKCEGKGYLYKDSLTDYHRRDYSRDYFVCKDCEGSGRVVIRLDKDDSSETGIYTLSGSVKPYKTPIHVAKELGE